MVAFPQDYAAAMTIYAKIKEYSRVVTVDIGGFTLDYLTVRDMTKTYVDDLLGDLRERGVDLKSGLVVFIGGGALLLKEYLENSGKLGKCTFIEDVCANAKGYKMLYELQKRGR